MKKLRIGVIGLGMGRWHVVEAQKHPNAEVAAIADPDKDRLKSTSDKFNVRTCFTSGEEMLKKASLDIVIVATPNKFHKELTLAAFKAGCHVLCEKPMAMSAQEAREMIEASRKADRRLMINFSYRFTPTSQAAKREVDSGTLGEIYYGRTLWQRRRGIPGFGSWFTQKALSGGGPLIDLGVHRLDLALWLMGYPKPEWVMGGTYDFIASALAKKAKKAYDVEDLSSAFIRFKNGATLGLEASWAGYIKEWELMETRLLGTKGGLIQHNLNGAYEFETEIYVERNGRQYDLKPHSPMPECESSVRHFISCVVNGKPHTATGEEGLVVMKLLDAIYESAGKGQPVRIK